MKFIAILFSMFAFSTAFSSPPADVASYQVQIEIRRLTQEILETSRSGYLSQQELENVRDGLREVLESAQGNNYGTSNLICTKSSNGLFYPTNAGSGTIVGSNAYSAGYATLESCRETLPSRYESVSCFKYSNGLFYPGRSADGTIIGSNAYSAGHALIRECRSTLPKNRQRMACYKQANGLYYPSNSETGSVIGSNAYSAGYATLNSCLDVLNQ